MKYKTMRINVEREEFVTYTLSDDLDREETETVPHPLGFYHYPETMSDQTAFNMLKNCMILKHYEEILNLRKSLKKLKELELHQKDSIQTSSTSSINEGTNESHI